MPITKAVIPAAGYGTRFLPVTKVVPKELLPVLEKPMIQHIVEEGVAAGVTHFILVTSRGKEALADYFDRNADLERVLEEKGDRQRLEEVRRLYQMARFSVVRQAEQLGLGHAILCARHAIGEEPFAVLLPDDIVVGQGPCLSQLLRVFEEFHGSTILVEELPPERISAYGVIRPRYVKERVYEVLGLVEKPPADKAPSNLGIIGRYVLTPDIFAALARVKPGARGEIQLTDGLALLLAQQKLYACLVEGKRYDVGTPLGMLQAWVEFALQRADLAPAVRQWLRDWNEEGRVPPRTQETS